MHSPKTERLIPRDRLILELSALRYGRDMAQAGKAIDQSTLWRWCDLAGVETGQSEFLESDFQKLAELCDHYRRGRTTSAFIKLKTQEQKSHAH